MAYKGQMLDNDIIYDMQTVSELYKSFMNIERRCREQGGWTQELVYEAYSVLAQTGFYDQIIGNLNNIYERIDTNRRENPLIINAQFLESFYTSLTGQVEIAATVMDIGNRVSKIHSNFLDRTDMREQDKRRLQSAYVRYVKEFKGTDQDILEVISSIEEYASDEYVPIHNEDYEFIRRNKRRDIKYLIKCSDKEKCDEIFEILKEQNVELGDFYKYVQSKELETLAYQIKNENLVELIRLQNQKPEEVKVKDATAFDTRAEEFNNDDIITFQIEIPGFSAPYRVHSYKSKINSLLGQEKEQELGLESVESYYYGANHLPYKLSSQQIEYLEKMSSKIRIPDRKAGASVQYMIRSIANLKEKMQKQEENRKQNENKEENDSTAVTQSISKKSLKRPSSKKDMEFLESLYLKADQMGINLSDEYKSELADKRGKTYSLASIYKSIQNYISDVEASKGTDINTEEAKRLIEEKSVKMYIYMKICTRKFWGITDKNKKEDCLEAGYDEKKIKKTIDGIKRGIIPGDLPEYVTGRKVKTKVEKPIDNSTSGKTSKIKCEKKKEGYTSADGSLEQKVKEEIRARILAKKEELEIAKKELEELIKWQQEELESSKNKMETLEQKIAGLDAISEEFDL